MICYLDSSVVLRHVFGEPHPLQEWTKIKQGFSSRLLRLECFRTIDRIRLRGGLSAEEVSERFSALHRLLDHLGLLPLTARVMDRAELGMNLPLGTLDGIHLATALLWREKQGADFVFATHDRELGLAARSQGLEVIGI